MTIAPGDDDGVARSEGSLDDPPAGQPGPPPAPRSDPPVEAGSPFGESVLPPDRPDPADDRADSPTGTGPQHPADAPSGAAGWRSSASDEDIDAAFAAIVSGMVSRGPDLPAAAERHPSAGRPLDTSDERARRRELRRLQRAAEVAAFAAQEAEIQAERDADEAHFEPPEPPPLPRPKGRTIGAVLMLIGGIALLVRPGLLAVGFDLTMVISVILILGGAAILLTGIWQRRNSAEADGWDDGAVV